ncbi:Tyrosine-protein kinase CSK [Orchesella cincta]|uniref:Tyrosine-protein kinase CSK n=1 Tax=Orchesella cincta TaxID=48709 RepID=A0A1D2MWU2_ORCCI|nr:Tyrosine-protein kinase CSK [Orchesella cincta]
MLNAPGASQIPYLFVVWPNWWNTNSQSESVKLEMGGGSSKDSSASTTPSSMKKFRDPGMSSSQMVKRNTSSAETGTTSIVVPVRHQNDPTNGFPEARARCDESLDIMNTPSVAVKNQALQVEESSYYYETYDFDEADAVDAKLCDNISNADEGRKQTTGDQSHSDTDSQSDNEDADDTASGGGDENDRPVVPLRVFGSSDLRNPETVGDGGFGRIVRGSIQGLRVAIKIFHSPIAVKDFHSELGTLTRLKHRNVVNILGIMKTAEPDCPQIVLHYFPEGNIVDFLKRRGSPSSPDYGLLRKLSLDVVDGCEYLHKRNIIHGNLAARNILVEKVVNAQKVYYNAKVSDYGIIRFAECSGGNYMKIGTGSSGKMIPIRWAPKELVVDDDTRTDFTFASDYWSFGVVLWEMWSKGNLPYGSSYTNLRVLQFLKDGYSPVKLHRPIGCPALMIEIMDYIFKVDPAERPDFTQIKQKLKNFRGTGSRKKFESKHCEAVLAGKGLNENQGIESVDLGKDVQDTEVQNDSVAQGVAAMGQNQNKKKKKKNRNKNVSDAVGEGNQAVTSNNCTGQEDVKIREDDDGSTESAKKSVSQASTVRKPNKNFHQNPWKEGYDTPQHHQKKPEKGGHRYGETAAGEKSMSHEQRFGSRSRPYVPRQFVRGSAGGGRIPHDRRGRNRSESNNFRVPMSYNATAPFVDSNTGGSSSLMSVNSGMPPPPPPYTPIPLPNHSSAFPPIHHGAFSPNSLGAAGFSTSLNNLNSVPRGRGPQQQPGANAGVDYDDQIKQLQEQIETLKTEQFAQELLKKSEELAEVMRRMTAQKIGSMGRGDTTEQHQHFDRSRGPRFYQQPSYNPKGRGNGKNSGRGRGGNGGPYPDSKQGNAY